MLSFGEMKTFKKKSVTIKLTNIRGIEYSALRRTRQSDKSPRTRVIPVEIRISVSFTKPYLSHSFERFGIGVQYIIIKI